MWWEELEDSQLQCECSPSAVPPYWQGYDGVRAGAAGQCSGTAEIASSRARSWNTTPRLFTPPNLSLPLAFSPRSVTLPAFGLRSWRFLAPHHHHLASIHSLLPLVQHSIEFLPLLFSTSSRAQRKGYSLIWIFECRSTSSLLGRGVVLQLRSCSGVMGPSAQGPLR